MYPRSSRIGLWFLLLTTIGPCHVVDTQGDFVVTRSPQHGTVSLATDAPIMLSFMVCGRTTDFIQQHVNFKIDVSRRVRLTPQLNSPLIHDSQAEIFGLSLSLANTTAPNFEMCNEVLIRVWTDHPAVQNASIDLLLITRTSPVPDVFRCSSYFLYSPMSGTTSVSPVIAVSTPATTPAPPSTTSSQSTISTRPQVNMATTHQTTDECDIVYLAISAALGFLLLFAVTVIFILLLVMKHMHHRKDGHVVKPMDSESRYRTVSVIA